MHAKPERSLVCKPSYCLHCLNLLFGEENKYSRPFSPTRRHPNWLASPLASHFVPESLSNCLSQFILYYIDRGIFLPPYIDDSYLQGSDYVYCVTNIIGTIQMFISLGFIIHPTKSILIPTQKLVFWGNCTWLCFNASLPYPRKEQESYFSLFWPLSQ